MANLKDLIVTGVGRFVDKVYASEFIGKLTGNADTATKATQDASGNVITSTYATKAQIADAVYSDDSDEYTATVPLNADTLGGKLPSDYAPAGFGLGTVANNTMADLNNATKTGWYVYGTHTANTPYKGYGVVEVITRFEGDTTLQIAHDLVVSTSGFYNHDVSAQRRFRNGAWQPWEYINPPMKLGVEYRTTERWNGKPVWTIAFNFGALPNNTTKTVVVKNQNGNDISFTEIVSLKQVETSSGGRDVSCNGWITGGILMRINISTTYDASGTNAVSIVKYTKD